MELMEALTAFNFASVTGPSRSLTATGRYTDISVETTPPNRLLTKQIVNIAAKCRLIISFLNGHSRSAAGCNHGSSTALPAPDRTRGRKALPEPTHRRTGCPDRTSLRSVRYHESPHRWRQPPLRCRWQPVSPSFRRPG